MNNNYITEQNQDKPWITTLELMGNRRGVSMNWFPTFLGSTQLYLSCYQPKTVTRYTTWYLV